MADCYDPVAVEQAHLTREKAVLALIFRSVFYSGDKNVPLIASHALNSTTCCQHLVVWTSPGHKVK